MAFRVILGYPEILVAVVCFLILRLLTRPKNPALPNWPLLGMLPSVLLNTHHLHDWSTRILRQCGHTLVFKGPWFANMDMLWTSDPANVHYILTRNFPNFPKGPEFKKIFEILGDGLSNLDSDPWKTQRKIAQGLIRGRRFQQLVEKTSRKKVESALFPVLEHVSKQGLVVDLQDVFQRFTFDSSCKLLFGVDHGCLSLEFPEIPFANALDDAWEAIFIRHATVESYWKLQRWLGIGKEKKMSRALETVDHCMGQYVSMKREQLSNEGSKKKDEEDIDLLTLYMECSETGAPKSDKDLKGITLNHFIAGRDTTSAGLSWFFWLVSKNPSVETKIFEELKVVSREKRPEKWKLFDEEELKCSVYLHGALCEALRLYPPVPFQHKHPIHPDVLPSGHKVDKHMKVLLSFYAMGRMEEIWGKDCMEFKPERWISEKGETKHEPSYKFVTFNAGPRTCLGKDFAFTQLKAVAAAMIYNYHVEVVEGHTVSPNLSIILQMKHGLMVKVFKRWN